MAGNEANQVVETILSFLEKSAQTHLLPKVVEALQHKVDEANRTYVASVTTAKSLTLTEQEKLKSVLIKQYGRIDSLVQQTDPALIAGFIVRIGDMVIDRSLRGKLDSLKENLLYSS